MKLQLPDDNLYYLNEERLVVFTAQYLLERGYCCGNGCVNCPYDFKGVPESKRSALLKIRKQNKSDETV